MPRGDKSSYTDKQKRKAAHIEEGYEKRGLSEKESERRAWATVNKMDGGGRKSGSGRGKKENKEPARKRSTSKKSAGSARKRSTATKKSSSRTGARGAGGRKTASSKTTRKRSAAAKGAKPASGRQRSRSSSKD